MTHTIDCVQSLAAWVASVGAYGTRWPSYCTACNAVGGFEYWDGEAGYRFEPCEACVGQGKCPRCGKAGMLSPDGDVQVTCNHCGWYDYADALPDQPSCYCEIDNV